MTLLAGKRFLAVIPARGGSQSVPLKNIKLLAGKPLLFYTLAQADAVAGLTKVVVSTDHPAIAAVAEAHGTAVIKRPAALSTNEARTETALIHALDVLEGQGEVYDYVVVLEPTSPFRSAATIERCLEHIVLHGGRSLMTVVEDRSNVGEMDGPFFRPLRPNAPRRRQERAPFFIESSTVYVASVDYLRVSGTLVCDEWLAVVVPEHEAVDINTPLDFAFAESILTGEPRR